MNEQTFIQKVKQRVAKKDELQHMSNAELLEACLVLNERVAHLEKQLPECVAPVPNPPSEPPTDGK